MIAQAARDPRPGSGAERGGLKHLAFDALVVIPGDRHGEYGGDAHRRLSEYLSSSKCAIPGEDLALASVGLVQRRQYTGTRARFRTYVAQHGPRCWVGGCPDNEAAQQRGGR